MEIKDFKLERFFAKWEFVAPYLLCASDCETFSADELLMFEKNSKKEFLNLRLGYTESLGEPRLRNEISKLYSNVKKDEIITFSGAQEAIFIFMNIFLKKGDHVIVMYPGYQSLYEIANSIGCKVTNWVLRHENKWKPDIDFLKKNITKKTKLIIINQPHNPTGNLMQKADYFELIKLAKQNGSFIFSDEVYRLLEYKAADRLPAMIDSYDNSVSLGVMSKTYGLAGLRIGWMAIKDKYLYQKIAAYKDYTTICSSAPSEYLSMVALKNKDHLIKRNLSIIKSNLKLLDSFFERYDRFFQWVRPKAGTIAFPKIKFNQNIEKFCIDVVKKKGVLLLPSTKYDFGNKHFRIGFGRRNMPVALARFEEYVKENLVI